MAVLGFAALYVRVVDKREHGAATAVVMLIESRDGRRNFELTAVHSDRRAWRMLKDIATVFLI